jgi:hypothetical protein
MDMQSPPAIVQMVQADTEQNATVEPTPQTIDVGKYIPASATAVTMVVTLTPPTGTAAIYAPGSEGNPTIFKGPRSINEVALSGPVLYIKLYGATSFDIQYTNYRTP